MVFVVDVLAFSRGKRTAPAAAVFFEQIVNGLFIKV